MGKNFVFTGLGLVALIGLLGGAKALQIYSLVTAMGAMAMPPTVVATASVESQTWERTRTAVGSLEAAQGVVVAADVPGRVTEITFEAGTWVDAGAKLIQQDVSAEQAQLRAAEAAVDLAAANRTRVLDLYQRKVVSEAERDTAEARYKEAQAQADNLRAVIAKKTVVAPFAGRLGIRLINLGQDLPSGTPIVSLQAADPMLVNFTLPQRDLAELALGHEVRIETDALPEKTIVGEITAIDPAVDPITRTVRAQATIANPNFALLSGMFVNVEVVLPAAREVLAVPITAVAYATYGDSVFVVTEAAPAEGGERSLVAEQQFVQLGHTRGDFVAVTKGLQAGQEVVVSGVFKLRNNAPVTINNEVRPTFELDPQVKDN